MRVTFRSNHLFVLFVWIGRRHHYPLTRLRVPEAKEEMALSFAQTVLQFSGWKDPKFHHLALVVPYCKLICDLIPGLARD